MSQIAGSIVVHWYPMFQASRQACMRDKFRLIIKVPRQDMQMLSDRTMVRVGLGIGYLLRQKMSDTLSIELDGDQGNRYLTSDFKTGKLESTRMMVALLRC